MTRLGVWVKGGNLTLQVSFCRRFPFYSPTGHGQWQSYVLGEEQPCTEAGDIPTSGLHRTRPSPPWRIGRTILPILGSFWMSSYTAIPSFGSPVQCGGPIILTVLHLGTTSQSKTTEISRTRKTPAPPPLGQIGTDLVPDLPSSIYFQDYVRLTSRRVNKSFVNNSTLRQSPRFNLCPWILTTQGV